MKKELKEIVDRIAATKDGKFTEENYLSIEAAKIKTEKRAKELIKAIIDQIEESEINKRRIKLMIGRKLTNDIIEYNQKNKK
jgi:hypothetical protein